MILNGLKFQRPAFCGLDSSKGPLLLPIWESGVAGYLSPSDSMTSRYGPSALKYEFCHVKSLARYRCYVWWYICAGIFFFIFRGGGSSLYTRFEKSLQR